MLAVTYLLGFTIPRFVKKTLGWKPDMGIFSFLCFMFVPVVFYLHVCMCTIYVPDASGGQKRTPDPLHPPPHTCQSYRWLWATCACWEPNSYLLEEQSVLFFFLSDY